VAVDLRLGLSTPVDYGCSPVRLFSKALVRAYDGMRRTQEDAWIIISPRTFPTQAIREMIPVIPWTNDDGPPVVICQGRELYLRPVYRERRGKMKRILHETLMGVDSHKHGGEWLSLYLVQSFLVG